MSVHDYAMKRAEQLVKAIDAKLNTKGFVRLVESPEFTYIELGFHPKGKPQTSETQVAYQASYFDAMRDKATAQDRGKRILQDVQTSMGLEDDKE